MLQISHAAVCSFSEERESRNATLDLIYGQVVGHNGTWYHGWSYGRGPRQRLVSNKPKRPDWPSNGYACRRGVRRRKWIWTPRILSRDKSNACCYAGELEFWGMYFSFVFLIWPLDFLNYSINQKSHALSKDAANHFDNDWEKVAGPKSYKKTIRSIFLWSLINYSLKIHICIMSAHNNSLISLKGTCVNENVEYLFLIIYFF